jgi:LCP family protein required for cell wall assembly
MSRDKRYRHSWPQRLIFGFNIFIAVGCLIGGGALVYANQRLDDRKVVTLSSQAPPTGDAAVDGVDLEDLPEGDLSAKNFLITGRDNNSCIDPDSPYAKTYEGRSGYAGLTDSIMMIRINPKDNAAAVLSFPRDLYVKIAKSDARNRINTAYRPNEPQRLVDTIMSNFGIGVDHYVSVDFCAFKSIVNAVGGVKVPFEFAARDRNTNFSVPKPGCVKLNGDKALAYVRSRKYYYRDPKSNKWVQDPSSDWGRIARQQDFIRRVLRAALEKGASNPAVANQLLGAALKNVITDDNLSPLSLLQLARAMRNVQEENVETYTVEGYGKVVGGQSVIEPVLKSDSMQQILAIFQGKASITDAADQLSKASITDAADQLSKASITDAADQTPVVDAAVGSSRHVVRSSDITSTTVSSDGTIDQEVAQQRFSVVPPDDPACR